MLDDVIVSAALDKPKTHQALSLGIAYRWRSALYMKVQRKFVDRNEWSLSPIRTKDEKLWVRRS